MLRTIGSLVLILAPLFISLPLFKRARRVVAGFFADLVPLHSLVPEEPPTKREQAIIEKHRPAVWKQTLLVACAAVELGFWTAVMCRSAIEVVGGNLRPVLLAAGMMLVWVCLLEVELTPALYCRQNSIAPAHNSSLAFDHHLCPSLGHLAHYPWSGLLYSSCNRQPPAVGNSSKGRVGDWQRGSLFDLVARRELSAVDFSGSIHANGEFHGFRIDNRPPRPTTWSHSGNGSPFLGSTHSSISVVDKNYRRRMSLLCQSLSRLQSYSTVSASSDLVLS
jgi:hypothetical protein